MIYKHIITIAALLLLLNNKGFSVRIEVEGINYEILSSVGTFTVEVAQKNYTGHIVVPSQITINFNTYHVIGVGYGAFSYCSGLLSVTLPSSVIRIEQSAFSNSTALQSVTLPEGLLTIDNNAFMGCTGLSEITIPSTVTYIGDGVFYECANLLNITIPSSVSFIGDGAFFFCNSLSAINVSNENLHFSSSDGVLYNKEKTLLMFCPVSKNSVEIAPTTKKIGKIAFSWCKNLTSINIPNSVDTIEISAFSSCTALQTVTLGNSVSCIEPDVFYNCSSLVEINLPNSITRIGQYAFFGCYALTNIELPPIKVIEGNCFADCINLASVKIPNSVTKIQGQAFLGCTSLKVIDLPNSVDTIEISAFRGCSNADSLVLPQSIKYIGEMAFKNCGKLKAITCYATIPPSLLDEAFFGVTKTIPVYVPGESINTYKVYYYWDNFLNYVALQTTGNHYIANSKNLLYPNLVNNKIYLNSKIKNAKIKIFDTSGKLVFNSQNINNSIELDFLPTGVYTIVINTNKGAFIQKIVKQ